MQPHDKLARARKRGHKGLGFAEDALTARYGPESMASLTARIRDTRADPNDRRARIHPVELGRILRRHSDGALPAEVFAYLCDVLEGKVAASTGRAPAYTQAEINQGKEEYELLCMQLKGLTKPRLKRWLAHYGLPPTESVAEAAASAVAKWLFPAMTGRSLRNRFSPKSRQRLRD